MAEWRREWSFWRNNEIFGPDEWFNAAELCAEAVAGAADGARFVELGTDLGRSTACMAVEIIRSGKQIDFVTIDLFADAQREAWCRPNLASLVERGAVRIVKGDSADSASAYLDGSVDLVFVDAAHDTASVVRDITAWLPKVKPGGIIAGDDLWWPDGAPDGVKRLSGDFPVWEAVTRCIGPDYDVMVRNQWAIWRYKVPRTRPDARR